MKDPGKIKRRHGRKSERYDYTNERVPHTRKVYAPHLMATANTDERRIAQISTRKARMAISIINIKGDNGIKVRRRGM